MAYRERGLLVPGSLLYPPNRRHHQQQQKYIPQRTFNNRFNRFIPSRLSSSQTFRIECKAEERHFTGNSSPLVINSSSKPIRLTMNDQPEPVQFRSEIIVHNNPETDVHIKSLRVAFHYHDATPTNAMSAQRSSPSSIRSQSFNLPQSSLQSPPNENRPIRNLQSASSFLPPIQSPSLLHQWIDDICANEKLMANDDIVFFIKNGEFFARI